MKEEILRIENVIRKVNGITYLDNINFNVFKGEIMGLIPLDNHGKSQLIELILQNVPLHFGRVYFDDQLVNYYEHSSMSKNRVSLLEQDTNLIEDLKVTDNIGVLNQTFHDFIIHNRRLRQETAALLKQLGIVIEIEEYVSELSILEKAIIELIRAALNGAQLIILNELSNFLSIDELSYFQRLLVHYTKQGLSFLYIANHHEEAFKICQRVALFEKGRIIKVISAKDFSTAVLEPYMLTFAHPPTVSEQNNHVGILKCQQLSTANLETLNFSVKKGECLTILDMDNRGIQDLAEIISGYAKPRSGKLIVDGRAIPFTQKRNLLPDGVAYIPENPVQKSLFFNLSYLENLTFLLDRKLDRRIIGKKVLNSIKEEYRNLAGVEIEAPDLWGLEMQSLYNLVYFRLLLYSPEVVFIMQPFSQADMYLRGRIIQLINMFKEKELAVVILAVSISDTLTVTDRLLILEDGKLAPQGGRINFANSD